MKKIISLSFLISIIISASCTINQVGEPGRNGVSDLQIRLPIGNGVIQTSPKDTVYTDARYDIIKFNKNNYVELDSIKFTAGTRSVVDMDTCIVQLMTVSSTNTLTLITTIQTDTTAFQFKDSENILSKLPGSETRLRARVISKKTGAVVEGGPFYLFLYR